MSLDEEKQEAIRLLSEAGWPHQKIVRVLGVYWSQVKKCVGASKHAGRPRAIDHRIIKALAKDGYSSAEIAEITGEKSGAIREICSEGELHKEPIGQGGRFGGPVSGLRTLRILKALLDGQPAKSISEEQRVTTQRVYQVRAAAIEAGLLADDKR